MTDESALLAAILAAPEDDTPRLVFADWLDENEASVTCDRCKSGEIYEMRNCNDGIRRNAWGPCPTCDGSGFASNGYAAKAEFIRIQVELNGKVPGQEPERWRGFWGARSGEEWDVAFAGCLPLEVGRPLWWNLKWWKVAAKLKSPPFLKYVGDDRQPPASSLGYSLAPWHGPDPIGEKEYAALRNRERELFLSAYPENRSLFGSGVWTYCLPGTPVAKGEAAVGSSVAVVERGFVDSVSCPWEAWRDHGDAILTAQPVRRVTMTTEPPTEESPDHADNVDWLEFQGMPETAERLDELRKWCSRQPGQLRNLRPHHRVLVALLSARWPSVREWVLPPEPQVVGEFMGYPVVMRPRRQDSPEPPPTR